jgi:tetratricopeptide (TPR) repeat protein/transcriptional regulator with XRE-family HTH domain
LSDSVGPGARFGEQLRRDRLAAGLTQEELAERSALSIRAISDLERGRIGRPRRRTLRQLASALQLPTADRAGLASAGRWRAQLPADVADFTGRREEMRVLTSLLTGNGDRRHPGAVVVSAVTGPGGAGKTTLAVHAAHQVAPEFPDGQLYLNLRGSSPEPVAPPDALARILRDMGADLAVIPPDETERAAKYRSRLAGLRLLIFLDDAIDAAQVRPLLPGTAGCAVLVTSRRSMQALESARVLELGLLGEEDAAALFAGIVGPARAAAEPDAVQTVLAACGGLPLAIRIAAARLAARPGWRIAALADRLSDARGRLDELQAGDLAVRASFMVSYDSTLAAVAGGDGVSESRAFRLLGLAAGPEISLPAAAALLDAPVNHAERALESLADRHLLQSAAPGRYRLHDLLRAFASERAINEEDGEERDRAVRRMLAWYVHTAAAAARLIHPNGYRVPLNPAGPSTLPLPFVTYDQALAWLDKEYANLVSAVRQAAGQQEHDLAWKLPASLWALFYLRGQVDDWIATHQIGLASARSLADRSAESWMLNNLGIGYLHARRPETAIACFQHNLPIVRAAADQRGLAMTLVNLGCSLADAGRHDEAMQPLLDALHIFRKTGNRNGEGATLASIGRACERRGHVSDAIGYYQKALEPSKETHDFVTEGRTHLQLSSAHLKLGQIDPAIHKATEAIELSRRTGNRYGHAEALAALGRAELARQLPAQARLHWLAAVTIFTELGHPHADDIAADLDALEPQAPAETASEPASAELRAAVDPLAARPDRPPHRVDRR